ncbi:predicted protein [Plenodomus lingam JN3]|uniref:Predicted protein n=1 Tax=Leptosphaeria maculans (strain JN3 / isolate v23.1.3 / race Av1-4-5-6-7-8) TaxID=985895 RepID=E5R524_LEPMJ|nr:predicted protein [Plenodomus lingam JN3]CBX91994.1 predicted protein [Plenodomus lingam JN3]
MFRNIRHQHLGLAPTGWHQVANTKLSTCASLVLHERSGCSDGKEAGWLRTVTGGKAETKVTVGQKSAR